MPVTVSQLPRVVAVETFGVGQASVAQLPRIVAVAVGQEPNPEPPPPVFAIGLNPVIAVTS